MKPKPFNIITSREIRDAIISAKLGISLMMRIFGESLIVIEKNWPFVTVDDKTNKVMETMLANHRDKHKCVFYCEIPDDKSIEAFLIKKRGKRKKISLLVAGRVVGRTNMKAGQPVVKVNIRNQPSTVHRLYFGAENLEEVLLKLERTKKYRPFV